MNHDLKTLKSELEQAILSEEGVLGIGTVLGEDDELKIEIAVIDETIRRKVVQDIGRLGFSSEAIAIVVRPPMEL